MASGDVTDRRIIIRPDSSGCGFDVTIEPALDGRNMDTEGRDIRAARGYAAGLRMSLGITVVDLSGIDR